MYSNVSENQTNVSAILKKDCSGCHGCVSSCPNSCIRMEPDEEGFLYPKVDMQKCTHCRTCLRICGGKRGLLPTGQEPPEFLAVWGKNNTLREQSSSGGLFTLLAEQILAQGGIVFGAAFNEQFKVVHLGVTEVSQLGRLRTSKYVQSEIGTSYREVKQCLEQGKKVLFTGTPCQIAGLKGYLGKEYETLYTQDLICHGVPSPEVWKQYLQYREKCAQTHVRQVNFRDKSYGWRKFSMSILFENNTRYVSPLTEDIMLQGFLSNLFLRPSCHACHFKTLKRCSDLTLADFWCVEKLHPELCDDQGISLVILHTEKGRQLFEAIKNDIAYQETLSQAVTVYNSAAIRSVEPHTNRARFFERLQTLPIEQNIAQCLSVPLPIRVLKKGKRVLRRILKL